MTRTAQLRLGAGAEAGRTLTVAGWPFRPLADMRMVANMTGVANLRSRFNRPSDWFIAGRGKPYFPATWEGWTIFLTLLGFPFLAMLLGIGS